MFHIYMTYDQWRRSTDAARLRYNVECLLFEAVINQPLLKLQNATHRSLFYPDLRKLIKPFFSFSLKLKFWEMTHITYTSNVVVP